MSISRGLAAPIGALLWLLAAGCGHPKVGPIDWSQYIPTPIPKATLEGQVLAVNGNNPITGANVKCQEQADVSDEEGWFYLDNLVAGSWTLTAERSGFESYSKTITLAAGVNEMNIEMSQSTSGTNVSGTVTGFYPWENATVTIAGAHRSGQTPVPKDWAIFNTSQPPLAPPAFPDPSPPSLPSRQ